VSSHISKIDGVYVCSSTAAEAKNRRELQLAPSKVPDTGLGEEPRKKSISCEPGCQHWSRSRLRRISRWPFRKPSEALPNWLMSYPGSVFGGFRSW
jgi:hypothetical protein